jgi:bacillithiol biosynthesis cysteine-adding enzyme BshC
MQHQFKYIAYKQTNYFSKIVCDYLDESENLKPLYQYAANIDGIKAAIQQKKGFNNRTVLVDYFNQQYSGFATGEQQKNIELLAGENCFTITTAHQPNIFTGPFYFIYKILHAIKLANELSNELTDYKFVPVYYMGSEDADLDELGNITLQGKKLVWNTKQTGAVGRMKVDKNFLQLITEMQAQLGVNEFGNELINIFKQCYTLDKSIQQATFELMNILFGVYGLLVVIPDNADLKRAFIPIFTKELTEHFSHLAVAKTNTILNQHYKAQAAGRELNLFYLIDDKRERIEKKGDAFIVEKLALEFTLEQILIELNNHPERFSANVILRPVYQETILPNIAFIGGGGELAYWLQLKKVFDEVTVAYPVLVLRNSFLLYTTIQENKLQKMGYDIDDLFESTETLFVNLIKKQTENNLSLQTQIQQAQAFYKQLTTQATAVDATLEAHTKSIAAKAIKRIEQLETKMLRAEKRKFIGQKNQLQSIKQDLFPNNSLQERVENFGYQYSICGKELFNIFLSASECLLQQFCLLKIK